MSEVPTKSLSEILKTIGKLHRARKFPAFIDWLRLHSFKNIANQSQIDFQFPITALIGANGCGKSSTLQALYGCPDGSSIGKYWFSTKLDPISDEDGTRPSLVYGYRSQTGEEHEVVKTRIKWDKNKGTSQNPDYWEPSRPLQKLGMTLLPNGARHPTVKKDVMVIDFRYQLSAFDRYFYLEEIDTYHKGKGHSKQDVIRSRSESIARALEGHQSERTEKVVSLTAAQCQAISTILGKRYRSGRVLHHRIHRFWAHTIVFEAESLLSPLKYTEANAGSGEVAVALLVHKLSKAREGSLVLLDEPEYSLHPGAQKELLKYLAHQSLEKKLQIVFTTHSPTMVEGLSVAALKVFQPDPLTDKFVIYQDRSIDEAFLSVGHQSPHRATIRVEDALAKQIVEEVLKRMVNKKVIPDEFLKLVDVLHFPGGVGSMKQDIALYSRDDSSNVFTVFDGTEKPTVALDLSSIKVAERTRDSLKSMLKGWINQDIAFALDGGAQGERQDQAIEAIERYVAYWNRQVWFLPFDVPESEIWCSDLAHTELETVLEKKSDVEAEMAILANLNPKDRFSRLAQTLFNNNRSEQNLALQTKFLKNWLKKSAPALQEIEGILLKIRQQMATH
jgi:predicted ATPase